MLNLLVLLGGLIVAFWFIGNLMGFVLMLVVAGLIGFAAESLIPGQPVRYGWMGAIGAGLLGSWIGPLLVGRVGPILFGVQLIPSILGALVLVAILSAIRHRR